MLTVKIKPHIAIIIVLFILIAGIILTNLTGLWSTKSQKNAGGHSDTEYSQEEDGEGEHSGGGDGSGKK